MKILRSFLLTLTALLSATVFANGIDYIVIENNDASTTQISLTDFKQIKFTDSQMMVMNDGATVATFMLKDIHKLFLGPTENTAIEEAEWDATGEVEVYSTSGILIKRGNLDEQSLPRGIYIIRQGNKVKKIKKL